MDRPIDPLTELPDPADYARRLQLVQRFGRIGLWERDIATGHGHWDAESFRIMGFAEGAVTPSMSTVLERLSPDESQLMTEAWARSIESRSTGQARFRITGDDGRRRLIQSLWEIEVDADGQPVRGLGVFVDETQALESTWQLAELTRRFELAASLGDLGVFQIDPQEGKTRLDARSCAIFELDRRELEMSDEDIRRFVHPDDQQRVMRANQQAISSGRAVQVEYRIRTARGNERRVLSRRVASREPRANKLRISGVLFDVTDSWRQRQALERMVHRLQLATTIGGIGIWDWQAADERWAFNETLRRQLGMPGKEESDDGLDALVNALYPDDREPFRAQVDVLLSGVQDTLSGEYRVLDPDRRIRHLSFQAQVSRSATGQVSRITGVSLDITARKHDAMQRQFLVDLASDGVWEWDVPGARTQRSQSYRKTLGYRADEVDESDEQRFDRIHPGDIERVRAASEALIEGRSDMMSLEYRVRDAAGNWRWMIERAAPVERDLDRRALRVLGSVVDTTWQHEVERQLRDEQELVAMATALSGVGVWVWHAATREIELDKASRVLYGLPDEGPLQESDWLSLIHPEDRALLDKAFEEAARGGRTALDAEFRVTRKDGQPRVLAVRGNFERSQSQRIFRAVGVNWDVTEQRRMAEAERAREAAERASAAKSEFLSRVSHELRTPLNAVLGFSELLGREDAGAPLDPRQRGYLQRIREAGAHLRRLIEEVLDLSRNEARTSRIQLGSVELQSLLAEAVDMVSVDPRAAGIRIRFDGGDGLPLHVRADALRLREIVWNLLTNAVKYNRPDGEVMVTLARIDDRRASVRVSDTGMGIDAAAMSHLFEPFNRLGKENSNIDGVGIGLAVSRGFAERMGAELLAESKLGVGSTFEIRLDLFDSSAPASVQANAFAGEAAVAPTAQAVGVEPPSPVPQAAVTQAHGKVVYVEDNALNRMLLEEYSRARPGLELITATCGEEGVRMIREHRPDLALLDIQLPDMTGFEVLARLQAEGLVPPLGCIALSADATPERVQEAGVAGFADYWTKPILPDAFLSGLDRLLGPRPILE